MNIWLSVMSRLFEDVFGRATPTETGVVVALCVLLGALALSRVGTALGAIGAFYTTGFFLIIIGMLLIGAAVALPPVFDFDTVWMLLLAAIAVLLVVVLPLTVLLQKGSYITAVIAWTVALLTVGAVLTVEPMVMQKVDNEFKRVHEIKMHRTAIEKGILH